MEDDMPPPPEFDDELPPPPSDIAEETRHFPPIKTKKSGPLASVKRALVIFEKDIRTMAKHGLISSIILFIFLIIIFSIMSFSMKQAMSFDIGGMMEGDDIDVPWATEGNPPVADAGDDRSIPAGTEVTLDASGSTDDDRIVHYEWHFDELDRRISLYGERVQYTFYYIGEYEVTLTVADFSINTAEDHVTITVTQDGSDNEMPQAVLPPELEWGAYISVGTTMNFDGSGSTDNVGVVNWTWTFHDVIPRVLYGEEVSYTFSYASQGDIWVSLNVRDASGNYQQYGFSVAVNPLYEVEDWPWADIDDLGLVILGDTITLDVSDSNDGSGEMATYTWYVKHNATYTVLSGETAEFTPEEWGFYEVMLVVRDGAGNYNTAHTGTIVAPPGVDDANVITWRSTPFGVDVSFNLLTYAYGVALLSSVIFVGGLFAKGYSHEIQKGTIKVLFFGPISVTTTVFSKILYPIVVGPFLIFPLVMLSLSTFEQALEDIFAITLVAYVLAAMTMVAAAYGSSLIYMVAKRMVLKPTVVSRMFLYLSLLGTMTVFEWLSVVLDLWLKVDTYGNMYDSYGGAVSLLSPFHQGGIYLSGLILETSQSPDWWVFAIPFLLIGFGIIASRKLYPDLFSRE